MSRFMEVLALGVVVAAASSCSTSFHARACGTDEDCGGGGLVCVEADPQAVCRSAAMAPLRIGMSAPITGPSQDLGIEMKRGITLAIDAQNAAGGVRGRPIELDFRDDQYNPDSAQAGALDLLDADTGPAPARCPTTMTPVVAGDPPVANGSLHRGPGAVLGLVGSVGTPTMVRAAPIAVETQSLFFGAFTGASKVLRDGLSGPCSKYIFNVRASYAQEARATVAYFSKLKVEGAKHFVSFDQRDSFGQAGYDGLVAAYTDAFGPPSSSIARFQYTRDDASSVPAAITLATDYLASLLEGNTDLHVVGVFMTDTYGAASKFIAGVRDWQYADDPAQVTWKRASRLVLYFSNVSFVGPNSLSARLKAAGSVVTPAGPKPYSEGVFVSQVVPNYETDGSDAVREYRHALDAAHLPPSFTSLEGYLTGRVFIAGLVAHRGPFTPEALIATFERLPPLNLGLGATSGFSSSNHNYSKSVFGTSITADGTFENRYFWSENAPIQLFE